MDCFLPGRAKDLSAPRYKCSARSNEIRTRVHKEANSSSRTEAGYSLTAAEPHIFGETEKNSERSYTL